MPPDRTSFTALNISSSSIPEWMGSFTLSAPPNTDLWRKPPAQNVSTAPILFTSLRNPFIAAEVTVAADWEHEWDQGGLVIFAGPPQGIRNGPPNDQLRTSTTSPPPYSSSNSTSPKWVKVGLEFSSHAPHVSTVVATADGADWCLSALPPAYAHAQRMDLRIKMERIGYALWLWYLDDGTALETAHLSPPAYPGGGASAPGVWRKIREVTWFFWGVEDKAVRVGVYVCRPVGAGAPGGNGSRRSSSTQSQGERRDLCVEFEGLEIF